jgi:hypothetical protein
VRCWRGCAQNGTGEVTADHIARSGVCSFSARSGRFDPARLLSATPSLSLLGGPVAVCRWFVSWWSESCRVRRPVPFVVEHGIEREAFPPAMVFQIGNGRERAHRAEAQPRHRT